VSAPPTGCGLRAMLSRSSFHRSVISCADQSRVRPTSDRFPHSKPEFAEANSDRRRISTGADRGRNKAVIAAA